MPTKYTINDGIRMVGQLLLHHPTTGHYARNSQGEEISWINSKASCFCYYGAVNRVQYVLGLSRAGLYGAIDDLLKMDMNDEVWDSGCDDDREFIAQKLADVREP